MDNITKILKKTFKDFKNMSESEYNDLFNTARKEIIELTNHPQVITKEEYYKKYIEDKQDYNIRELENLLMSIREGYTSCMEGAEIIMRKIEEMKKETK